MEKEVIKKIKHSAITRHNIKIDVDDRHIDSLIRYVYHIAFTDGYTSHKEFIEQKHKKP